jgi:hypothetical protein
LSKPVATRRWPRSGDGQGNGLAVHGAWRAQASARAASGGEIVRGREKSEVATDEPRRILQI